MGLVFGRQKRGLNYWGISTPGDLVPRRVGRSPGAPFVSADTALTHSAVWAALRVRAMIVSTLPVDAYRYINFPEGKRQVDANLTPFMTGPKFMRFRYASQVELDRSGNAIGIITDRDRQNNIADIDLQASSACAIRAEGSKITKWIIHGTEYEPEDIWHEVQYPVAGFPLGLSPVAYSAMTLGQWKSVQEFATQWFTSGNGPRASLKNTEKKLDTKESLIAKEAWRASQSMGEPFVHGSNWEYQLINAQSASTDWLDAMKASNVDVARFFGVPSDVIDAAVSGESVTYSNLTQKNLDFLIYHMGPTIEWREAAFTQLLPRPRFVKLNGDALLRMDPKTRAQTMQVMINARYLAPNEARALENREPFTPDQIKEFELLGLNKTATGALTGAEGIAAPTVTQSGEPSPAQNQGN